MPLGDFRLTTADISWHGKDLSRPECVLALRDGTLLCSDDRGGVTRIEPDGRESTIGSLPGLPNGFALERGGSVLVAEIDGGKVYRIFRDGRHEVALESFAGRPLGSPNFVLRDGERMWLTVSTRTEPRRQAVERMIPDGYILAIENGVARLAADGFCFTNEIRIDRAHRHLYVAETGKGRIVRLAFGPGGALGAPETYGPETLFPGARVDGITFDAEGNLWVTEISRNGIYVITPGGACRQVFEDPGGKTVDFPASLVFTGPDLKTVHIGSTRTKRLATFRSPVAGEPLAHWQD